MHRLIPDFILDAAVQDRDAGAFDGVALFIDTSGFTPLTKALTAQSVEGAEVIAAALDDLFGSLVTIIYAHGGLVAGFAGDAVKAVFPDATGTGRRETALRALAAAHAIRLRRRAAPALETAFGTFRFSLKAMLADGAIQWDIWRGAARSGQQRAYRVFGPALNASLRADAVARTDDIIVSDALWRTLPKQRTHGERVQDQWRWEPRPDAPVTVAQPAALPPLTPAQAAAAAAFFPPTLLHASLRGEFRPVVTAFVNLSREVTDDAFRAAFFDLLHAYDGYLCRLGRIGAEDAGTTMLLFWGAPTAHEDDAARAVGFLSELKATAGTSLRAGVTSGVAYAGFVGAAEREEYTCHGERVNLAARLMTAAGPGEIWLDGPTAARRGRGGGAALPARQHRFKGFDQPQTVHVVTDADRAMVPGPAARLPVASEQLVGRHHLLTKLLDAVTPAAGTPPAPILLSGEAGSGKSRLVAALADALHTYDRPVQLAICPCDGMLRQSLNPFRRWLRDLFATPLDAPPAERQFAFERALAAIAAGYPEAAELTRLQSLLAALVDVYWDDSLFEQLAPRQRFDSTLDALQLLLGALAHRQPLLLVIEDGHWLDVDSRSALARLLPPAADGRLTLLMTSRGGDIPDDLQPARWRSLALEPLDGAAIAALAHQILGRPIAPALRELLEARSDGNPLFVVQLLRLLQETDELHDTDAGITAQGTAGAIPVDVRQLLTARIDRLPAAAKTIVHSAAILGREFELAALRAMTAAADVDSGLSVAARAEIWAPVDNHRYAFRHALLRDAAYAMQLRADRRARHCDAAEALRRVAGDALRSRAQQIAFHFDAADAWLPAAEHYHIAGEHAWENFQLEAARHCYTRIAQLSDAHAVPAGLTIDAVSRLGQVEQRSGAWQTAEQQYTAALAMAEAHADRARAADNQLHLSHLLVEHRQAYDAAVDLAQQAMGHSQALGDSVEAARALQHIAMARWRQDAYDAALEHLHAAQALIEADGPHPYLGNILSLIGILHYFRGEYDDALASYRAAAAIGTRFRKRVLAMSCAANIGLILMQRDDLAAAQTHFETALALGRELGSRPTIYRQLGNLATVYLRQEKLDDAEATSNEALRLAREGSNTLSIAEHLLTATRIHLARGRPEQARAAAGEGLALARAAGSPRLIGEQTANLGHVARAAGQHEQALAHYAAAAEQLAEHDVPYPLVECLIGYAHVLLDVDNAPAARPIIEQAAGLATTLGISAFEQAVDSLRRAATPD